MEEEGEGWKKVRKKKEDRGTREERRKRWFDEREERIRRERRLGEEKRERKLEEERRRRERNVIWRGVEGEDEEERLWLVKEIMRRTLRREVEIRGVEERKGEGGRWKVGINYGAGEERGCAKERRGDRETLESRGR